MMMMNLNLIYVVYDDDVKFVTIENHWSNLQSQSNVIAVEFIQHSNRTHSLNTNLKIIQQLITLIERKIIKFDLEMLHIHFAKPVQWRSP